MGMGRRVSCPHFLVSEGTRRASDGPRTARSKGPAICRKAGRGVTLRRRACPATWRQSCRLCRPRRRFYRRRVRTPYALKNVFAPLWRRRRRGTKKRPYMRHFPMVKCREFWLTKVVKFTILMSRNFYTHIWTCFGAKRRRFLPYFYAA